jgi:hypothetical protein
VFELADPALRNGAPPRGVEPPAGEEGSESRLPGGRRALKDGEDVLDDERATFMSLEPPAKRWGLVWPRGECRAESGPDRAESKDPVLAAESIEPVLVTDFSAFEPLLPSEAVS